MLEDGKGGKRGHFPLPLMRRDALLARLLDDHYRKSSRSAATGGQHVRCCEASLFYRSLQDPR